MFSGISITVSLITFQKIRSVGSRCFGVLVALLIAGAQVLTALDA
jgi:hypothetical protein